MLKRKVYSSFKDKIWGAANQTKYGQIKTVKFTIDQLNFGYRIIIQRCIQHIMKENLLLLKDLLELLKDLLKPKSTNI